MVTSTLENQRKLNQTCAFCSEAELREIINFGDVALAGGFLNQLGFETEKKRKLLVCFCEKCFAVQVTERIPSEELFSNYFYFSSAIKTLKDHFADYATEVTARFLPRPEVSTVIEIGCNDGILLKPFADQGIGKVVGVDPAKNIVGSIDDPRIVLYNECFTKDVSKMILDQIGSADLVVANNVFAHIPDINSITSAIYQVLKDDGVFIFEVHYLGKILQEMQYDMIYHEHMYYYSLIALENHFERHDMKVFDVKPISIHGGSMRYYVAKKASSHASKISNRVGLLRQEELEFKYNKIETYQKFAQECSMRKKNLMDLIENIKRKGKSIAGYGASGRANTIIQFCGISRDHLDYIIDDSPAKHGYYTPGSHLEIKSSNILKNTPPDYLLVFAWAFYAEIAGKCRDYLKNGGRIIVPLPEVRVTLYPTKDDML